MNPILLSEKKSIVTSVKMRGIRQNMPVMLALCTLYFFTARLGLSFAAGHPCVTAVWPPTGLSIAALLLFGKKLWPGVFLGALLANWSVNGSLLVSFCIAIGNTSEAVLGVWLMER